MNETISVVVPIYNGERYLDRCIQSIAGQTYANLEIILVNDGSQDSSAAICDAWAQKDPRIKVIHKPNRGVSDSRNVGIQNATGNWVTFVDADDVVSAYLVESLLQEPLREDSLHLVNYTRFTEECPQDNSGHTCRIQENNDFLSVRTSYFCWGALYSRDLILRVGLWFDTNLQLMEDEAWLTVYLLYVRRICFIPESMYYYRQNPNSVTGSGLDRKKWVHAWNKILESVFYWFAVNDPDGRYRNESRRFYRHCQNKLMDSCVRGKLDYATYRDCKVVHSRQVQRLLQRYFPLEYVLLRYFSPVYFWAYTSMMRIRNILYAIRHRT